MMSNKVQFHMNELIIKSYSNVTFPLIKTDCLVGNLDLSESENSVDVTVTGNDTITRLNNYYTRTAWCVLD